MTSKQATRMTKAEARRRASRQLSTGHYRPGAGTAWVTCPECRSPITVEFRSGRRPTEFLRAALMSHLIEEH